MADALVITLKGKVQYPERGLGDQHLCTPLCDPGKLFPLSEPQFPCVCSEGIA